MVSLPELAKAAAESTAVLLRGATAPSEVRNLAPVW